MNEFEKGFYIGDRFYPWGTTLSELCFDDRFLGIEFRSAKFSIDSFMDLQSDLAFTSAPAPDRPVMDLWYELVSDGQEDWNKDVARLSRKIGASKSTREYLTETTPSSVKRVIEWDGKDINIGISVYGAPRRIQDGLYYAGLWINWTNSILAASPYAKKFEEKNHRLEDLSRASRWIIKLAIEREQAPFGVETSEDIEKYEEKKDIFNAKMVLRARHLFNTPKVISNLLNTKEVGIWKNITDGRFFISNKWNTSAFETHEDFLVEYIHVLPAKGTGASYVHVGDFTVVSKAHSPSVERLIETIQKYKMAKVEYTEADDC